MHDMMVDNDNKGDIRQQWWRAAKADGNINTVGGQGGRQECAE
jgi:hypothetical protein